MKHFQRLITLHLLTASLFVLCNSAFVAHAASAPRSQRIVSLAPSVTETLFALGFGNRVVGVTTYCDYPAEARKLPKIGGFMNPSLEAIAAKRPDGHAIGATGIDRRHEKDRGFGQILHHRLWHGRQAGL